MVPWPTDPTGESYEAPFDWINPDDAEEMPEPD